MANFFLKAIITIALFFCFSVINPGTSYAQSQILSSQSPLLQAQAVPSRVPPNKYIGVWKNGSGSNIVTSPLLWNDFLAKGEELTRQGLRLIDVETLQSGDTQKYIGVWSSGSGSNIITPPQSWSDFLAKGEELTKQNLRLVDVETFKVGNTQKYIGVWSSGSGSNLITPPQSWSDFVAKGKELTRQGLRLVDVETLKVGNTQNYIGVWRNGSGSNIITSPQSWPAFLLKGKELTEQGLRLVDVETFSVDGARKYVGVWSSGSGSNLLTPPQVWSDFLTKGEELTKQGLRLADVEIVQSDRSSSSSGSQPDSVSFPPVPSYIKLSTGTLGSQNYRIMVDFSRNIDGKPEITLPSQFLSVLPTYEDKLIFPDNVCGFRVAKASRFVWLDSSNRVVNEAPYISIPESQSLKNIENGEVYYFGGIDFTGPIGACSNSNEDWYFPFPFTEKGDNPRPNLKLVIELENDSEIKFLNFQIRRGEPLNVDEIFKPRTFRDIMAVFNEGWGYGEFDEYVQKVCEESPSKCPIGDSVNLDPVVPG